MTLKVPLTGTSVVSEGAGIAPAQPTDTQHTQRQSLHSVRMGAQPPTPVEVKGEFDSFGRLKWRPVETQAQAQADGTADVDDSIADAGGDVLDGGVGVPPLPDSHQAPAQAWDGNALHTEVQRLSRIVDLVAQSQLRSLQPEPTKPQAPTPPDVTQFDMYEPAQVAEYTRLNNAYIQAMVRHEVNAAMEPHGQSLQDARLNAEYNGVFARHGQEPTFKPTMEAAIKLVARFPQISIPEAYEQMASIQASSLQQAATTSQPVAKPARTITAQEAAQKAEQAKKLPASNGVSGTAEPGLPANLRNPGALGRIMYHNQQSGRARPIGN